MAQDQKSQCSGSIEHCPQVQQAAEDAVHKVFAILGVDVDVPKEVEEFRENLRFGASMRRVADKGMLTIIGVLVTAMLAAMWAGIVSSVVKGH